MAHRAVPPACVAHGEPLEAPQRAPEGRVTAPALSSALVREAPRGHERSVYRRCDTWRSVGVSMTLLPSRGRERKDRVKLAMLMLGGLATVLGLVAVPVSREMCCFHRTKRQSTGIQLTRYAYEAYPVWRAEHPATACPSSLDDLRPYANSDRFDAWGNKLVFRCATFPAPALWVQSAGPDGELDTSDDLARWSDGGEHPTEHR